ncbi:hypothetical protein F3Y22_tig00110328pilonHSYRG00113 [Hibiscus syriacus]|uniref:Uncharacterized protein n=1 Tax=Hibiscus syriacus TaxID=106335 RepID=A0A6A3AYZ0_HIBSY|nr:hypothetical protein F3Y22_tig00110328pilonHSYRG00113 [Hibiscus syriacus]
MNSWSVVLTSGGCSSIVAITHIRTNSLLRHSFLLLFSTSSFFSSLANAARKPVLDSEGKALRSGVQYYIVSTQGAGGALLASRSFVPGADPECKTSTTWKVDDYDPSSGKWWLTLGGGVGNPVPDFDELVQNQERVSYNSKVRLGLAKGDGASFYFFKAPNAIKQVVEKQSE